MEITFLLIVAIVIFALAFDFINGFHDTANAIATSVSTRALSPRMAIVIAASMNFIGALAFTGVAQTVGKDIVDPFTLPNGMAVVLAALLAAIFWNLLTWYYGIPSSSSHALIGSIAGAAIASAGVGILDYSGFLKILQSLIISPFIALFLGFLMMTLFTAIFKNFDLVKTNRRFRYFQIVTASMQAFSHGTNDAQKVMGIITLALVSGGYQSTMDVEMWVRFSAALAMGAGTAAGGWKIIKTVGGKIIKLRPVSGAAADLTSALIIFGFTTLKLPVSTTHVISSAIMGVGSAQRIKAVKWGVAGRIILTWVFTLPASALIAALFYHIVMFILSPFM